MIEKIKIKEVATYDTEGIEVNLKKINFIFGSNGTGKTTISEFLSNRNDQRFSSCSIDWKKNKSDLDIFVYNRYFVQENFNVRNKIKGIFTLGKESSDILELIDQKNEDIKEHKDRLNHLEDNIKEKNKQLKSIKNDFMNKCWDLKLKYDNDFKEAFKGFRNNREKFMEKCLKEAETENDELYTYDDLKRRRKKVIIKLYGRMERMPTKH